MVSLHEVILYKDCPLRWKLSKEGVYKPVREKQVFGDAIHDVLTWAYLETLADKMPSPERVIEYFLSAWPDVEGDLREKTIEVLAHYVNDVMKYTKPKDVSRLVSIPIDDKESLNFYVDLIAEDEDGDLWIDFRTSHRSLTDREARFDTKLSAFACALETSGEKGRVGLDVLVRLKRSTKAYRLLSERTEEDIDRFKAMLQGVLKGMREGIVYPHESVLCAGCDFYGLCFGEEGEE